MANEPALIGEPEDGKLYSDREHKGHEYRRANVALTANFVDGAAR